MCLMFGSIVKQPAFFKTGPALAVDAVKAGIETANEIADEYEQSGLSMSTFIVAGKAAGEAAIDVGAKKFRLPGLQRR